MLVPKVRERPIITVNSPAAIAASQELTIVLLVAGVGEFGIRLALGAQAGDITRLVLAFGAKLALIGSAIGVLGASAAVTT